MNDWFRIDLMERLVKDAKCSASSMTCALIR